MRPYMETVRENPLRDDSDKTQSCCIDLGVQGGINSDDEEQKTRSLIQSLIVEVRQSPDKHKLMAELSRERRQGVPRDFSGCQGHCE